MRTSDGTPEKPLGPHCCCCCRYGRCWTGRKPRGKKRTPRQPANGHPASHTVTDPTIQPPTHPPIQSPTELRVCRSDHFPPLNYGHSLAPTPSLPPYSIVCRAVWRWGELQNAMVRSFGWLTSWWHGQPARPHATGSPRPPRRAALRHDRARPEPSQHVTFFLRPVTADLGSESANRQNF